MRDLTRIVKEMWQYLKERKKWWLVPAVIVLFVFGFLIVTAGTTAVPVFIYPLV